jgi:tRNA A-37 threonylcarbamoyl transferase component Bud32
VPTLAGVSYPGGGYLETSAMPGDAQVKSLLEEILESDCTPEEACQACPELLIEVRHRLRRVRALEAEVEALFPTPGPASTPGDLPDGRSPELPGYDVQSILGRGGMGVVYKARHRRLNRAVALKMLITGAYAGPDERARFQREAEAVASLHHANIVAVHDVGDHEGCPYFTMELLEGGSLARALGGTPQPDREAAALLITLAEAVQAAHRAGIVHRDMKPANILLTADGTPKVADFGLARHFEGEPSLTLSGARVGTPSYMAPEQVSGRTGTIGPAADIYALGALLYEVLTGRPPFRGETATETERQVIHDEPVPPSRLNTKVPRDLETICLKCLSKEPQRRYASAAALADDLRRFGEGRPIQARSVGWGERSWRWCRRNPTVAALLVTALALVGLASGGGMSLVQRRAELHNDVATAVAQAERFRKGFHFREARESLERVRQRLEPAGPDDLRRQAEQAQADLNLAERLDAARIKAATLAGGKDGLVVAEPLYVSAFAEAGLGMLEIAAEDIEEALSRRKRS